MRLVGLTLAAVLTIAGASACSGSSSGDGSTSARPTVPAGHTVTEDEYRSALQGQIRCVRAAGWRTTALTTRSDGILMTFGLVVQPDHDTEPDRQHAADVQRACYERQVGDIERVWFMQHVPRGAARSAMYASLIHCLEALGVSGVQDGMEQAAVMKQITRSLGDGFGPALTCMDQHAVLFPEVVFPASSAASPSRA